ncbi:hypothetical protein [Kitasatospora sp. GP82]|uniref:hypothetical protein n=1 Tax=Kitasatospora sp. GP82 TaxID=3035089 RepID=UPI00247602AD|nr:hypothetical protein [Kitasatospora sp. GP82]MDH6129501.1 hypothetical protein [Kitasatospora sp. GP82]
MRIPMTLVPAVTAALATVVPIGAQTAGAAQSPLPPARNLTVAVTPPSPPAAPGASVPFTVRVCNQGTETPASATLVVNGPADEGMELSPDPAESGPVDRGWNWIRFPVAKSLAPSGCETHTIYSRTLSTLAGPHSYSGGTAVVTWDDPVNPVDSRATWDSDISAPVTGAYLKLVRAPLPTAPGNPADFEVEEHNGGPSTDYPWRGRLIAQLPPGSKFLSSAPTYAECTFSADGTTATCPDTVSNTWSWANRGFAVQVARDASPGTTLPVTLTWDVPANPEPHTFVLHLGIPVC